MTAIGYLCSGGSRPSDKVGVPLQREIRTSTQKQLHQYSIITQFGEKVELITKTPETVVRSRVGHVFSIFGDNQRRATTTLTLDMCPERMLKRQCLTVLFNP